MSQCYLDIIKLINFLYFLKNNSLLLFILQSQLSSVDQMRGMNMPNFAAMEQTRMLANTLAQNADPKFQVYPLFISFIFLFRKGVNHCNLVSYYEIKEDASSTGFGFY